VLLNSIKAICSRPYPDDVPLHSVSAAFPAHRRRQGKAILWLVACAWELIIFPSALAQAGGPPGSVYVPLDSWVYLAFDRLAGLGAINEQFAGLRPWTRIQCAQLVVEAEKSLIKSEDGTQEAAELDAALRQEFSEDINVLEGGPARQVGVESVYSKAMGISGTPLRDSFYFGQTISNDFGRPFNTGFNNASGFSAQAVRGRFFAYLRGEYQRSPAYAGLNQTQQAYIELQAAIPTSPNSQTTGTINQFDLLDTYFGMRLGVFDVAFGKQSLWWGPGTMGGMLMSDNIDPVLMLKVNQVQPLVLPSVLKYLGPVRVQGFMGRLADYHYPRGPYIHGEKIMLKPSPNLEIGFSRTTMAFGQGIPFTFRNLISTYFSVTDIGSNPNPQDYPGKRFGGLDFSYRLPYLRRWVTIYTDNMNADDVSPLVNPSRAMYNPGIYVSQVPRFQKIDFRFEVANTRTRGEPYTSFFYREGYTNKGFLIGDTVGRHGSAFDASSTYWLTPRRRIQVGWREERVSKEFIPSGGSQDSLRVKADWLVAKEIEFSVLAQREHWRFPFLDMYKQSDNVFSLQFTVYPQKFQSRTAWRNSD
jgi:hypothetical protein